MTTGVTGTTPAVPSGSDARIGAVDPAVEVSGHDAESWHHRTSGWGDRLAVFAEPGV
jgi:hypothetical protein